MGSPVTLLTIFAVYLWFVLKAGPAFMKNRPPLNVTLYVRLYNIFQVVACICFVTIFHQVNGFAFNYTWKCAVGAVKVPEEKLILGVYYLLLRLVEFLETVFFILRKKQEQVSALHIYHHISTAVIFWLFFKYNMGKALHKTLSDRF